MPVTTSAKAKALQHACDIVAARIRYNEAMAKDLATSSIEGASRFFIKHTLTMETLLMTQEPDL